MTKKSSLSNDNLRKMVNAKILTGHEKSSYKQITISDHGEFEQEVYLSNNNKLKKSLTLPQWQAKVHKLAVANGWWETDRPIPELLCLMHSEISEALEAYRVNDSANFNEELADLAIRLMDLCEGMGINLEEEVAKKHEINLKRPYRHGGKKC